MKGDLEQPELSDYSRLCGQVLQDAEVIVAAEQATCWNAGVQPQNVIALLASLAGWCGQFQKAGVICSPSRAWHVEEEQSLCGSCMRQFSVLFLEGDSFLGGNALFLQ